jgi:DNA-binding protein H-NS
MAQTLAQITKQIEKLQKEADALRQTELKGVIDRIRVAISHYGLTPDQLGFGKPVAKSAKPSVKPSDKPASPKFANENGQVWSGRGPRPLWLREALAEGRSLDEFSADARKRSSAVTIQSLKADAVAAPKKSTAAKGAKGAKRAKAGTRVPGSAVTAVPTASGEAVSTDASLASTAVSKANGRVTTRATKTAGAKKAPGKQAVATAAKGTSRPKGKRLNTVSPRASAPASPVTAE